MKIGIAGRVFQFYLISSAVYISFLILLVILGFWQLGRAEEKRQFIDKQSLSGAMDVVELSSLIGQEGIRYRKIKVRGQFDQHHQFLIDNQVVNGKVGYFVLTPFKIDGTNQSVLINRGWVALTKDRRILPIVRMNSKKALILGQINDFPVVGLRLAGAEIPTKGWPSVVQVVDSRILAKKLEYPLLPFQIELDEKMPDGYLRSWKALSIMSPEKHIAYAIQWFGLAITLTVLFIWFSKKINE